LKVKNKNKIYYQEVLSLLGTAYLGVAMEALFTRE